MLLVKKEGQTIVEFLLVLIPFLMLVMGIMQMAYIAVSAILVNHSAFAVARVGVVNPDYENLKLAADKALPFRNKEDIEVEVLSEVDDPELSIRITYKVPLFFPVVNTVIKQARGLKENKFPLSARYSLPKEVG